MNLSRKILIAAVAGGLVCAAAYSWYRWEYPYGDRSCMMPCTMMELRYYADANDGWFPRGSSNGVDCLRLMYPRYLGANSLAGISGDQQKVKEYLETGRPLDESVCSWVYWPGFRTDDPPELAIIWERAGGVSGIGRRKPPGTHAVGFVTGEYEHFTADQWPTFLKEQAILRSNVLSARLNQSKHPE
jgi:hypothetical protein